MSVSSGGPAPPSATSERPKKLQRISQACDLCHRRSIRCRPSSENPQSHCQNCFDFGVACTYNRPSRRRRNPSVSHGQATPPNILPNQQPSVSPTDAASDSGNGTVDRPFNHGPDYTGAFGSVREGSSEDELVAWRSFAFASLDTVDRLLRIYMDVVYPIFPLFHGPTLWDRVQKREHLHDRCFYASVMGACALASARARDGALADDRKIPRDSLEHQSEIFYSAAAGAMFKDFNKAQGLGYLRACGLLAMTAIQYGQIASMHQYLGHFCTLSAMQQFHDEGQWPQNITITEREERRRLFWSMYKLDILAAVVFDGVLKFQEISASVSYPSEVDDESITPSSCGPIPEVNWFRGWNFTTDLYRVLEHATKRLRRSQTNPRNDRVTVTQLLAPERFNNSQVMDGVVSMYYQLPTRLKNYTVPLTGIAAEDLYGFQAANIQATLQLVRMTLFSVDMAQDVHQKCAVAEELLSTLHSICPRFLTLISTPLVYHLGGIGHILATVMEGSLTEDSYQRVRSSLVSMADLLEGLESGLQPTAGASKGLRNQVEKIDRYMQAQRSSTYRPSIIEPQPMTVSYPSGSRSIFTPQQQPMAPTANGYAVPATTTQFQVPQEVVGDWPWPSEPQNDPQHPVNNVQGFNG